MPKWRGPAIVLSMDDTGSRRIKWLAIAGASKLIRRIREADVWLSLLRGTSYSAGEGCSGCSRHSRLPGALCRRCWGSDRALFPCSGSDAVPLLFLPPQLPPSGRHCVGLDEPTCTPKDYDSLTDDALHQLRWRRGYSALRPRSSTMETLDRKRACGTQDAVCMCVCV